MSPARIQNLLKEHEESARLSKKIATILEKDGDLAFSLPECQVADFDLDKALSAFESLNFNGPIRRLKALHKAFEAKIAEQQQASLF